MKVVEITLSRKTRIFQAHIAKVTAAYGLVIASIDQATSNILYPTEKV